MLFRSGVEDLPTAYDKNSLAMILHSSGNSILSLYMKNSIIHVHRFYESSEAYSLDAQKDDKLDHYPL